MLQKIMTKFDKTTGSVSLINYAETVARSRPQRAGHPGHGSEGSLVQQIKFRRQAEHFFS
jgi:hypothetical protein